jgi:hypothetical protein
VAGDAAGDELTKIVDEPPLERKHPVQQPHVQVLKTMVLATRLPRREAQPRIARFQVAVEPGDVRVGVVEHVVLAAPEERARAHQVDREGHDPVHPCAG